MSQKGLAPILIVLILAVLIGGYLVYQNQPKPTPSPQPTNQLSPASDETANWKTYTNSKYGFSFKYPSDLVVSEPGSIRLTNEVPMSQVASDKYINILIFVHSIDPQIDLKKWVEKDTTRNRPDGTVGSIVVGTIENYKSSSLQGFTYHGGAEVNIKHVVIQKKDNIIDFTLDCYQTGCSYKDNPDAERIFNQILSTFKFTQ